MKNKASSSFLKYIIPQYDEIALFAMSLTFALLLLAGVLLGNKDLQFEYISPRDFDPRIILAILVFFAGFVLSIYHAFVNRPKTSFEKSCMLFLLCY